MEEVAPQGGLDELGAAAKLRAFRDANGALRDLSFDTISAAGPNGALPHYKVDETTNRAVETGTLYLVDSGGHYDDGTTDITRTIAIRSEEHTSELQSLMRTSYAVFCLKKKTTNTNNTKS